MAPAFVALSRWQLVHLSADGAYSGRLSFVKARRARPRRIETPIESFGNESTLSRIQPESTFVVATDSPGAPPDPPPRKKTTMAGETVTGRFMAVRKHEFPRWGTAGPSEGDYC